MSVVKSLDLRDKLGVWKSKYELFRDRVEKELSFVNSGAASVDGGLLTDHGVRHVETVITRASQLTNAKNCDLTEYEVFLLLAAIHLHDVGNIHGRQDHQCTLKDVGNWLGATVSSDTTVLRTIMLIAAAHTSSGHQDKDTISKLLPETHILNKKVRPKLLAAILRFADELSDERQRASQYLLETGKLPPTVQIYHHLSYALHSVVIDHESREVELHFEIRKDYAVRQFEKCGGQTYLLDEILERSKKIHLERVYAMYSIRDVIQFDAIRVFIEVFDEGLNPIERIGYKLAESGYPSEPSDGVYTLAPELAKYHEWKGQKVTGAELARRIEGRME
ncbi:MAG: hypothetical protein OXC63_03770 [Aestuariivita sp.]|nr:hypothetical protein [Aestuariivita sp.]MCY4346979.1 hypothetical protein [Aestuariivita sp.]